MIMGVVADDLTGACDVASAIRASGLRTAVVLDGTMTTGDLPDVEALVAGLKIRTVPAAEAVSAARRAAEFFLHRGVDILYQKYCSTFDSTPRGNIGPIADALTDLSPVSVAQGRSVPSIGTPATPAVGRTQVHGHLFVGDRLLSRSALREHPLTPMRESDLRRVLAAQTSREVASLPVPRTGPGAARMCMHRVASSSNAHLLLDALDDADLRDHARLLLEAGLRWPSALLAGGAGLAGALAAECTPRARGADDEQTEARWATIPTGRRVVFAGSTSPRTREQTADAAAHGADVVRVDPAAAMQDSARHASELGRAVAAADPERLTVVTAAEDPRQVRAGQERWGIDDLARAIEGVFAHLARFLRDQLGVRRLVVAGGESSGAVATALGAAVLHVGPDASTGVPWMVTTAGEPFALLLKSGNFGGPDLFTSAWEYLP